MEVPAVFQKVNLVVEGIELVKVQDALQRPADRRQQLLANRALRVEVYFQNGPVLVTLD